MSELHEPTGSLVTVDLNVPGTRRRGRAFLTPERLGRLQLTDLAADLKGCFVDTDDEPRLRLLERVVASPKLVVETYPGETPPVELHAYLRAPEVSEAPIFACVLAPPPVVHQLASMPPHVVFETASFQALVDEPSRAVIVAGLEAWVRRMWPESTVPAFELRQWPDLGDATMLPRLPPWSLTVKPMLGAPPVLQRDEYLSVGEPQ